MGMTTLIAELSTSHGGERAWMSKFIESVALAGFDFAKFQSGQTKHLKASDPQFFWQSKCELSNADHVWLVKECSKVGVSFLTTAYHWDRVYFLHDLGLHAIKVGSGEGGNTKLLEEVSRYPWKIYLSTGLWTQDDLNQALRILHGSDVVLMHTVSEYPTPMAKANLRRMEWLRQETRRGRPVGYSDHTIGKDAALAAIAMGADALEVHHSLSGAPRVQPWDKDLVQLKRIAEFAKAFTMMTQPNRMLWAPGEARPYVGRWQEDGKA